MNPTLISGLRHASQGGDILEAAAEELEHLKRHLEDRIRQVDAMHERNKSVLRWLENAEVLLDAYQWDAAKKAVISGINAARS